MAMRAELLPVEGANYWDWENEFPLVLAVYSDVPVTFTYAPRVVRMAFVIDGVVVEEQFITPGVRPTDDIQLGRGTPYCTYLNVAEWVEVPPPRRRQGKTLSVEVEVSSMEDGTTEEVRFEAKCVLQARGPKPTVSGVSVAENAAPVWESRTADNGAEISTATWATDEKPFHFVDRQVQEVNGVEDLKEALGQFPTLETFAITLIRYDYEDFERLLISIIMDRSMRMATSAVAEVISDLCDADVVFFDDENSDLWKQIADCESTTIYG